MRYGFSHPLLALLLAGGMSAGVVRAWSASEPSPWLHRAWQTEDGLPDNNITGVVQTQDNYLWVATKGGVLRFNGFDFTALPLLELQGVPSRAVRAMLLDSQDRLWLGMERGPVVCLEPDALRVFTKADGLPGQVVMGMTEDQDGGIWISYFAQLRRIKEGQVTRIDPPTGLRRGTSMPLATDVSGQLWVARGPHLSVFRAGEWSREVTLPSRIFGIFAAYTSGLWVCSGGHLFKVEEGGEWEDHGPWPGEAAPRVMFEDHLGALWIGTQADGLFRLADGRMEAVPTSHHEVTCISEDLEGNIWVGTTGGGLNLIRPRSVQLLGRDAGLPFESTQSVCQDTEGRLWAVSQQGELARASGGIWELISGTADWPGGGATCVAADPGGGVWIGTSDAGLIHHCAGEWQTWRRAKGLPSDHVRSLLVTANHDVWVATAGPAQLRQVHDGQLRMIRQPGRLGAIRAMAEDADGTVWIGTAEGQLLRVSGSSLITEPAIRERITLSIRCLYSTPDGSLWIGYAGDGLGRLKDGNHTRVTMAAGLRDDYISQLLADDNGLLWILGNRGLSSVPLLELHEVVEGREERVRSWNYGRNDGLPAFQPTRDFFPTSCRAPDGRLWFSTRSGLLVVEPDKIRHNPPPPPVILESVSVDDQELGIYGTHGFRELHGASNLLDLHASRPVLRLGPEHGKVELEFAGLSFASPENVRFRYRLTGFDQQWIEAGANRRAIYPRLPADEYEFRALACSSAGVWNETGAALSITASPFFWETWQFKVAGGMVTVLAAGGGVYLFARRRYRRRFLRLEAKRALEQERARIAKDLHDDLGASLTRITLLSQASQIDSAETPDAAENLEQIHATARQLTRSMEVVVWAVNPEHDTFDGLANYMSNYAQSFLSAAEVRCRLEMPMRLPTHPLSAEVRHNLFLAFKEALNNVVKHAAASEVRVSLIPEEKGFTLRIQDNGRGIPGAETDGVASEAKSAPPHRNGLANMRSRLQEIGGVCDLDSSVGQGTRVTFSVPFER